MQSPEEEISKVASAMAAAKGTRSVSETAPPTPRNTLQQAWGEEPLRASGVRSRHGSTLTPERASWNYRPSAVSWSRESLGPPPEEAAAEDKHSAILKQVSSVIIVLLSYAMLVFVFNLKFFLPYDSGFAAVVLWSGAMLGGQLARIVGLPQLLGMLCSGIFLKNCGDIVRGLEEDWAATIRAFGLMNILMRGGLEMDLGAVRRVGFAVVRLTVCPGVAEAFASAGLACAVFDMPFFLALAMGFILAAVSPAVVVGGMFDLQSRGYGVAQGIPSLVVAAASFDDVVAISGFSMFIGLAIGNGNIILEALHGPINIIAGVACGMGGAYLLCLTKLWDTHFKRSAVILLLGLIFTFSSKILHFSGAGALASLVMSAGAAQLWSRGAGGSLSIGPDEMMAHHVEEILCNIWVKVAEPLLFSVIGSALDFSKINVSTIPKAIGLILGGVVVRCAAAMFATYGAGLTKRERVFIALAWMPKATVQAALGTVPLSLVRDGLKREDDPAKYDKYEQWGIDILTTAVFSILLTAPVGLIVIQKLGPRWLEHTPPTDTVDAASNGGKLNPVMPTVDEVHSSHSIGDVDSD